MESKQIRAPALVLSREMWYDPIIAGFATKKKPVKLKNFQKIAFFTPKRYKNGSETEVGVRAVIFSSDTDPLNIKCVKICSDFKS